MSKAKPDASELLERQMAEGVEGAPDDERAGVSTTFYRYPMKYSGMDPVALRSLKGLEQDNRRLARTVARLEAENALLHEALGHADIDREIKQVLAEKAVRMYGMSQRKACELFQLNRSTYRNHAHSRLDELLRLRIRTLAAENPGFGYRRLHTLLREEGWLVGPKKVLRLYREEGLTSPLRPGDDVAADGTAVHPVAPEPTGPMPDDSLAPEPAVASQAS
jgi:putative transposase